MLNRAVTDSVLKLNLYIFTCYTLEKRQLDNNAAMAHQYDRLNYFHDAIDSMYY